MGKIHISRVLAVIILIIFMKSSTFGAYIVSEIIVIPWGIGRVTSYRTTTRPNVI